MLTLPWLRQGSLGGATRSSWATDKPQLQCNGGSVAAITSEKMTKSAEALRSGGTIVGLTTVCSLATEFSYPGIRFQADRLEMLARRKFSAPMTPEQIAVFGGTTPATGGVTPGPGGLTPVSDDFWHQNVPRFPQSWPLTLPVLVRDPSCVPSKWQIGMGDELVLAFWKMVDFVANAINQMQATSKPGTAQSGGKTSEVGTSDGKTSGQMSKLECYQDALKQARALGTNVVIQLHYVADESAALDRALSFREGLDDWAEFLGLTGWQRVLIIGQRRDHLRTKQVPCGPNDVASSLEKVEWSAGKEVTGQVVSKALTIYDRMMAADDAQLAVMEAQSKFGRMSPFEDWTKLLLILQSAKTASDASWALWTMVWEIAVGKRSGAYSQDELKKKTSPVAVILLRKRFVDGLAAIALTSPIDRLSELSVTKHSLVPQLEALKRLRSIYVSVASYFAQRNEPDVSQVLPKFATNVRKLLRTVLEGRLDKMFVGFLASPPRGGFNAINFEMMSEAVEVKGDIAALREALEAWTADVEGRQAPTAGDLGDCIGDCQVPSSGRRPDLDKPGLPSSDAAVYALQEVSTIARENRCQYVKMIVVPDTKDSVVAALLSSAAMAQGAANAAAKMPGSAADLRRTCFLYSVGLSWDPRRPDTRRLDSEKHDQTQGRRTVRRVALWKEDFVLFVQAVSELVTSTSEDYVAVFVGPSKRGGAGLASEAGLVTENNIIELFRKHGGNSQSGAKAWHVKRIVVVFQTSPKERMRGVTGSMQETVLLFYRGVWPNRALRASPRKHCKGTTWDDVWYDATAVASSDLALVPYKVKTLVFDLAWKANLKTLEEDGAELADDGDDLAGKKGTKRTGDGDDLAGEKGKTQKKKATKKKDTKKKRGKKNVGRKKQRKSASKIGILLPEFSSIAGGLTPDDIEDQEPLVHHDLHVTLVRQALDEWEATNLVCWTVGSGSPLLAAVLHEVPAIGLCLNDVHLEITSYLVDAQIAKRLQTSGNTLYDKDLSTRVARAIEGKGSDDDDGAVPTEKPKRKRGRANDDSDASVHASGGNNDDDAARTEKPKRKRGTPKKKVEKKSIAEILLSGKRPKKKKDTSDEDATDAEEESNADDESDDDDDGESSDS